MVNNFKEQFFKDMSGPVLSIDTVLEIEGVEVKGYFLLLLDNNSLKKLLVLINEKNEVNHIG